MTVAPTPHRKQWPTGHRKPRLAAKVTLLIVIYVVLGTCGLGMTMLAAYFADPCSPDCLSVGGSPYDDFSSSVLTVAGLLYLGATIPIARWRRRGFVWLVPVLVPVVVTVGSIAMLLAFAPAGTFCDCGYGA